MVTFQTVWGAWKDVEDLRDKGIYIFCFVFSLEMAGYHQRSQVSAAAEAPQHHRVQGLLPEGAHSMGEWGLVEQMDIAALKPSAQAVK